MAFNFLQSRVTKALSKVSKSSFLTKENIEIILNEIKSVLIEADVNIKVVNSFIEDIRKNAIGTIVEEKNTSSQVILKIVNEELIKLLGSKESQWKVQKPDVVMFVGLQGSGKTTTSAKLANYLTNTKKYYSRPLLVGLDIYRPAAIDQLNQLSEQLKFDFYSDKSSKDVIEILKGAIEAAKKNDNDLIILDTAGRLQTNEELMNELKNIKSLARPSEVIMAIDAMSGQEIINVANDFNNAVKLTGVIITKLDSEAKGGSALSVRYLLNIPILFIGTGEKVSNLEQFYPDRIASRILGLGDIKTLTEKAIELTDEKKQEKMFRKMIAGNFDMNDLLDSIKQMQKMGNLGSILKLMPGMKVPESDTEFLESKLIGYEAIVNSMTKKERRSINLLNHPKRKERIIKGSGRNPQEYNELLRRFEKSQKQIKELVKQLKAGKMPNLGQGGLGF